MPDSTQLGWNETIRTEPFTSVMVAMHPKKMYIPWELPNSVRLIDPDQKAGFVNGPPACINNPFALQPLLGATCVPFTQVDPTGGAVNITNSLVNYGYEYVYHCHLLGHEEHDMMRPISFAVSPEKDPSLNDHTNTTFTFTDNSVNETHFVLQRSTDNGLTWTDLSSLASGISTVAGGCSSGTCTSLATGATIKMNVPGAIKNTNWIYRVIARNLVGCNATVPALPNSSNNGGIAACSDVFTGWPTLAADSPGLNTIQ